MNKNKVIILLITIITVSLVFNIVLVKTNNKGFNKKSFQLLNNNLEYIDKEILTNTIISIPSYINDYGKIQFSLREKIFYLVSSGGLSKEENLLLSKHYYLTGLDIHDLKLKKYNKKIGIDTEILNIIEAIVN